MKVLHVAGIELLPTSGMGRISYEWKLAFEKAGHEVIHVGLKELNKPIHPLLFGKAVRNYIEDNAIKPDLILAHEPASGFLYFKDIPLVVFSHGIEERAWFIQRKYNFFQPSFKSSLVPVAARFYSNNKGFRKCSAALLSNNEDVVFLRDKKKVPAKKLHIFHNGYYPFEQAATAEKSRYTFLYNATWIPRKGIGTMYAVFNTLLSKYPQARLILAGTAMPNEEALKGFDAAIHDRLTIIRRFNTAEEAALYKEASIFVMTSYFEGQSVALTQAMHMGLCPVVSSNCGQKDFITHGQNGLLFETGNADDLLKKIEWLLKSPDRISEMANHAKKTVQSYTWQHAAGEVVKICESVL